MFEVADVARLPAGALDDAARIDLIAHLERLKCAAEAAQAQLAADLDASTRRREAEAGVPTARWGRGVAAQIALARRESVHRGRQHLALAIVLPAEMPHTWAAFRAGHVTEWRATLLARETARLTLEDRRTVDAELAADPHALEVTGERELVDAARKRAYQLDPASFVERRRRAESERHVSLRPAPDVMSQLSALLPVQDGVAVLAALTRAADSAVATGDPRSRGQLMADTLVARLTGTGTPAADSGSSGWTASVVVPDAVLTGQSEEAGHVQGYGPVPADLARELAAGATWLRRLYATPATGALVAMDSRRRLFPAGLAAFVTHRDRACRMPWCDAPVRHVDHARRHADGGATSAANAEGLCEVHNHAKEALGWHARARPGPRHTVETTTPTGHTYTSVAPPVRDPVAPEHGPRLAERIAWRLPARLVTAWAADAA